jgi:hypothetical protein
MAKAPQEGTVKTRLVPYLTPGEATGLSICFLQDVAARIAEASAALTVDGLAVYTPVGAESAFDGLLPDGFRLLPQRGHALGERLFHATEDLLASGYTSVCLVNSDSPTLPTHILSSAVTALSRKGDRVVLGVADDGGYYLIGLKLGHRRLFADIEWSTNRVSAQTIERAAELGLEVELLPAWYDVDDAASLSRLCDELFPLGGNGASPDAAPSTRRFLATLIEVRGRDYFIGNSAER